MKLGKRCFLGLAAAAGFSLAAAADKPPPDLSTCHGYKMSNLVHRRSKITADLDLIGDGCAVYSPDVAELKLLVEYQTDTRLHVVIQDRKGERWQVPEDVFPRPTSRRCSSPDTSQLSLNYTQDPFTFQVKRASSGEILFDSGNSLIFERQFLRIKTSLPDDPNLYGLGEHIDPFRLYTKNYTRNFWSRDSGGVPYKTNLYGNHPIYFEHRDTGTHGALLMSSNGMDIKLDQDKDGKQYMEYSVIGGIFDFYFLAGPSPVDVAKQYATLVGKPAMVPYWSLGFHHCRYGYQDWFEVAETAYNYSLAGIPVETFWTDIDYMDRRATFSLDPERFPLKRMQQFIHNLHSENRHFMLMIDPAMAEKDYPAYNRGIEMDVFMKKNGKPYRGVVWPGVTVFPDWTHPNALKYWSERFHETFNPETGVDIDGAWIDMNEPASFCHYPCDDPDKIAKDLNFPPEPPPIRDPPRTIPGFPDTDNAPESRQLSPTVSEFNPDNIEGFSPGLRKRKPVDHDSDNLLEPPYQIQNAWGPLSERTVDTDVKLASGAVEYDMHNVYGAMMSWMTHKALLLRRPGLRSFIITRSTFVGLGRYASKWLGDNSSIWDHYRSSISGLLQFASIYQVPVVGSDVCGFLGNTTEKLCARWATLGAFSTFYRNHNVDGALPQEFYRWDLVTKAAKYAIDVRYRMLDYIYTALHQQSTDGTPAISPLWYFYPEDKQTFGIDLQYFFGDAILVSPVTEENATDVRIYLPDDMFYDFETHEAVRGHGDWVDIKDVPFDRIPLHVRGGYVIPLRSESANTTVELRKKGFELLVAPGVDGTARGSLFIDDGVSLDGGPNHFYAEFEFADGKLKRNMGPGAVNLEDAGVRVDKVTVLGKKGAEMDVEVMEL